MAGVQQQPGRPGLCCRVCIERIAQDGVADAGQVQAQLVRAAGQWLQFQPAEVLSGIVVQQPNFFGAIEVDIDAELAQLGPTGYRPLRVRDTLF